VNNIHLTERFTESEKIVYNVLRYAAEEGEEDREECVNQIMTIATHATAADWRDVTAFVLRLPGTESKNRFIHVAVTQLPKRVVDVFSLGLVQRILDAIVTAQCDDVQMQSNARSFNTRSWLDMLNLVGNPLRAQVCQKVTRWGLTGIADLCSTENALIRAQDDLYETFWENHHYDLLDIYVSMINIFQLTNKAKTLGRKIDAMPRKAMPTTAPFVDPSATDSIRTKARRALFTMMSLPANMFRLLYHSLS
jgi:hypothetical protein